MTLYVQLLADDPAAVKSEVATFFETFPEALVFGNVFEGHAIDTVLVGQAQKPAISVDEIEGPSAAPGVRGGRQLPRPGRHLRRRRSVRQLCRARARPEGVARRRAGESRS